MKTLWNWHTREHRIPQGFGHIWSWLHRSLNRPIQWHHPLPWMLPTRCDRQKCLEGTQAMRAAFYSTDMIYGNNEGCECLSNFRRFLTSSLYSCHAAPKSARLASIDLDLISHLVHTKAARKVLLSSHLVGTRSKETAFRVSCWQLIVSSSRKFDTPVVRKTRVKSRAAEGAKKHQKEYGSDE